MRQVCYLQISSYLYVFTAQGHYLISKLASLITKDVLREGINGSARRYSLLPWLGVHTF